MARDWRCRLWLVAVILAVITACSGSPSGSGSGETPAGQQTSSSPEQVAAVFDELVNGDITAGVYEDLRAVLVLVGGRPLVERYYDSSAEATSNVASVTKSVKIGPPVSILFEGWDASGKGGALKRLVQPLDPRHVRVAQFAAPTDDEKRHHFLWRFWPVLPGWGGMAVFDRSWYGRVLVERVEGFATNEEWSRAYAEIVDFERSLWGEGMIMVKFWLHLSDEEQLKRFKEREEDPLKRWKLTPEDWRNREKRPQYTEAVEDMLARTDHGAARWQLVEADSKRFARVKVLETVIAEIERGCRERGFALP